MSYRFVGACLASILSVLAFTGCGSKTPQTPSYEIHDNSAFSKEELNAPLSAEARAKGAQVAPPPTR